MHVAIIILNWNGKKDTLECLESLHQLDYKDYEIVVVDNGSTDGSLNVFSSLYPDIILLDNKENLGFAEGNNKALKYVLEKSFDAILLLNNDTIVHPSLLKEFVKLSEQYPKSILGSKAYLYSERNTFDHFGGNWNFHKGAFDLVGHREKEDNFSWESPFEIDYVCGCALFAKTTAFREIGLLDARFFLFWEETDFCFRAKQLGYKILVCPQAKIWHKVSASFVGGKPHMTYFWWRNRLLWIEKNLTSQELIKLYFHRLIPEIFRLIKHHTMKSFQYLCLMALRSPKRHEKKRKLLESKSALCGIKHYCIRRFYNGPCWIFKSTQK